MKAVMDRIQPACSRYNNDRETWCQQCKCRPKKDVACDARSVVAECRSPSRSFEKTFIVFNVMFRSTFPRHIHVCWFCSVPSPVWSSYGSWEFGMHGCCFSACHSVS
jgi:hypothetical protein